MQNQHNVFLNVNLSIPFIPIHISIDFFFYLSIYLSILSKYIFKVPVSAPPDDSDELDREADWIYKHGFCKQTITNQEHISNHL